MKLHHSTKRDHKKTTKTVVIILGVLLLIACGYFAIAYATKKVWPFIPAHQSPSETSNDNNSPSNTSPSDEDNSSSQDAKKRNEEESKKTNTPSTNTPSDQPSTSTKRSVEVGVAYASADDGVVEIRAFTPSVIESTGTCTAILTQGSQKVTRTSKAFVDFSTSQCEPITIPVADFPHRGTWTLVVTYDSDKSNGTSAPQEIGL